MKLSEIGERGLIERINRLVEDSRRQSAAWDGLLIGIGDDAAAYHCRGIQLATVDSLIEGIHFTREMTTFHDLGHKALAINLSDIAAMGGQAGYALVDLCLPESTEVADVEELYSGMLSLAGRYGVAIIGGDTNRSPTIFISTTVIGSAKSEDALLRRNAARPGDQVAVTGYLGTAAAGLDLLRCHRDYDNETEALLRRAFLTPEPRLEAGQLLAKHGIKCAIDVSDGLLADLAHILLASSVSARIEEALLPIQPAVKAALPDKALEFALSGGEDYELIFTAIPAAIAAIREAAACPITIIGEVTAGPSGEITIIDAAGKARLAAAQGWEHFRTRP